MTPEERLVRLSSDVFHGRYNSQEREILETLTSIGDGPPAPR
jgi:hypothetical protein